MPKKDKKVSRDTSPKQKKTKLTFKKTFRDYLDGKIKLEKWQTAGVVMLVFVLAGFIGWVYEFIFDYIDLGGWYMQGGDLLPWINIYAFGALLLLPIIKRLKYHPWAVLVASFLTTGAVELIGGWLVYTIGNGARYWDYNNKPWNFGNIGGFVCLLSVTIFTVFSMLLAYVILPWCIHLAQRMSRRAFLTLAISLFTIVMLDEVTNLVLKNCGLPNAMDFYQSLGWKYCP